MTGEGQEADAFGSGTPAAKEGCSGGAAPQDDEGLLQRRQDELLDRIPGGVCLSRMRGNAVEPLMFNSALAKVLGVEGPLEGRDPEELMRTCVHPDDLQGLRRHLEACAEAPGDGYVCRYRMWSKAKGAYIWIETHANSVFQDGEILTYSTYSDVTDMQQVRESLEQSQEMMAARLELERKKQQGNNRDLLFFYVANVSRGVVTEYRSNLGGSPTLRPGLPFDRFVGVVHSHLAFPEDYSWIAPLYQRDRLLSRYHTGLQQEEYRTQMVLLDGKIVWTRFVLQLLSDPYTKDIMLYVYAYDIGRERILEMLLKLELNSGYEAIGFHVVREGQLTVLEFGEAGGQPSERVLSFSDYIRECAATHVHPDDRERFLGHYLGCDYATCPLQSSEIVYRVMDGDGAVKYCKGTLYLYEEDGKRFCTLTRRDYTDIVRAEEEEKRRLADALLRAEEAGAAKDEFMARMSHDMRTPLNAIVGLAALTLDEADNPVEVRANMSKMQSASRFLQGLVDDILDMAKIEDRSLGLNPSPYSLRDLLLNIRTVFLPQCEAKGISLAIEAPKENFCLLCDKTRLNQVLYNVLSNAVKYTPSGGAVEYRLENLRLEGGCLSADHVVRDTGIGMSDEYQEHMFEPFTRENNEYTAELQGSGLGLGIAKQLVGLMGGTLHVDSKKGRGTTVTIRLSFECLDGREPGSSDAADGQPAGSSLEGKVVLLAEDNPINAEITSKLLRGQGMSILRASNGRVAVDMFGASDVGSIDIILMDIRMPEMDGLQAAAAIRALDREDAATVPIVALSANAYPEDVRKCLDAGMDAHVSKPMSLDELYRTMGGLIARP